MGYRTGTTKKNSNVEATLKGCVFTPPTVYQRCIQSTMIGIGSVGGVTI